jgi:toxin ParE1/3/4
MSEARSHIEFAQSARDDLRDILDWYASQEVPQVGTRMVLGIVERVRQLAMFPDSGKVVPELETPWLRELEHLPFRIVYRRDESVVTVVRVWRSARLIDSKSRELDWGPPVGREVW